MPGRTSRTVVHIIRAATYDGQGVETDLWESDLAPPRKQGGRNTHRTPKGTAPPPDPTVIRPLQRANGVQGVAGSNPAVPISHTSYPAAVSAAWLDSMYRWASTIASNVKVRSINGFNAPDSRPS